MIYKYHFQPKCVDDSTVLTNHLKAKENLQSAHFSVRNGLLKNTMVGNKNYYNYNMGKDEWKWK